MAILMNLYDFWGDVKHVPTCILASMWGNIPQHCYTVYYTLLYSYIINIPLYI
jgi:hypothetical protein